MDGWLGAHLPWLAGPWGWVLLLVVTLVPMVFVAVRRRAGFETYWRMPLHILGIVLIVGVLRLAGPAIGLPDARTTSSLNLIFVPLAAFLWAFLRYRGASQGGDEIGRAHV